MPGLGQNEKLKVGSISLINRGEKLKIKKIAVIKYPPHKNILFCFTFSISKTIQ